MAGSLRIKDNILKQKGNAKSCPKIIDNTKVNQLLKQLPIEFVRLKSDKH